MEIYYLPNLKKTLTLITTMKILEK
jgi:hypothetical protein